MTTTSAAGAVDAEAATYSTVPDDLINKLLIVGY